MHNHPIPRQAAATSQWRAKLSPRPGIAHRSVALHARDAMPGGGKLCIEGTNHLDESCARVDPEIALGQYVAISVTDSTSGMMPEGRSRVFEPSFTTKPARQGTGPGLAQVYGFVRQSRAAM